MLHSAWQWTRQVLLPRLSIGHAAAVLLLVASGFANVRYGLQLGHTELERFIAVAASVGADLFSAVGFIFVAGALTLRHWGRALAGSLVLVVTLCYALTAGLGFAAQTRGEFVGPRLAIERSDKLAADHFADVRRQIATIDNLPKVTKAQLNERKQLVIERNGLEKQLQAVKTIEPADPLADSIATYLAALGLSVKAAALQPWFPLMFVLLVVLGGPIAMWMAEHRVPAREQIVHEQQTAETSETSYKSPTPPPQQTPTDAPKYTVSSINDNEPEPARVVRAKRIQSVTPTAGRALKKLEAMGGYVVARTQGELAGKLGLPRTSFRRTIDRLEAERHVVTSHGPQGYQIKVSA